MEPSEIPDTPDGLTPFCGVDDHHSAERPVALVVVNPDLHFEGGQRWERLVPVFVHGGVGRGHHLLLPASGPVGAERHDVAEALAVLELLGHGLGASETEGGEINRPQWLAAVVHRETGLPACLENPIRPDAFYQRLAVIGCHC